MSKYLFFYLYENSEQIKIIIIIINRKFRDYELSIISYHFNFMAIHFKIKKIPLKLKYIKKKNIFNLSRMNYL